jgi:hypothetical protein
MMGIVPLLTLWVIPLLAVVLALPGAIVHAHTLVNLLRRHSLIPSGQEEGEDCDGCHH